jgi:hypothetical protein
MVEIMIMKNPSKKAIKDNTKKKESLLLNPS